MDMSFYEAQGRKSTCGVSPGALLDQLESNLHNACLKYNFLFAITTNKKWSIQTTSSGKYRKYNNEYRINNRAITISVNKKERAITVSVNKKNIDAETILVGAALVTGASHIVGTGVCIVADKTARFVKEKILKEKPEPVPDTKWYDTPAVKEIVGFLTIGATILVSVLLSEKIKPKTKINQN
jgi:hypothetical protein